MVSLLLAGADGRGVAEVRNESRRLVMGRWAREGFRGPHPITTGRCRAPGAMPKEPQRLQREKEVCTRQPSPLFYHRPDRSGPRCRSSSRERPRLQRGGTLIDHRMGQVRPGLPCTSVETRIDGAFLNRTIVEQLNSLKVECTIPVPFGRFATLKGLVEGGKRWRRPTEGIDYLETRWKPKLWNARHRFIPIEKRVRRRHKLPFPAILIMGCA